MHTQHIRMQHTLTLHLGFIIRCPCFSMFTFTDRSVLYLLCPADGSSGWRCKEFVPMTVFCCSQFSFNQKRKRKSIAQWNQGRQQINHQMQLQLVCEVCVYNYILMLFPELCFKLCWRWKVMELNWCVFWPRPLFCAHENVNQFDLTICISQN